MTEDEAKTRWPVVGRKNGHSKGYVRLRSPDHPNADEGGYVYEHVYVASRLLGRGLKPGEVVHHVHGRRADNARLLVCTHAYHQQLHARLAASPVWPEFPPRATRRPKCGMCGRAIQYDSVTGLCGEHYFARMRASPAMCRVLDCEGRAGTRSGLCLAHVRQRSNRRRYQEGWDYHG